MSEAYFLSLCVEEGDGGLTLSDLADRIIAALADPSLFFAGLTAIGCSLETLSLSKTRRVLVTSPALFRGADVPRVRDVDPGITQLRYTITLDASRALEGAELSEAASIFGLELTP